MKRIHPGIYVQGSYLSRTIRWALWSAWYLASPAGRSFDSQFVRGLRIGFPPWRKFTPNVWRSASGGEWHVYLKDDSSFVERRTIEVDVHVSFETGEIVGLDIWDETLKQ